MAAAGCAILLAASAPAATPQVTRDPNLAFQAVVATDELDLTTTLSGEDVPRALSTMSLSPPPSR